MVYRNATSDDLPGVSELQQKYHVSTIREEDKADGFVTTLFTPEQFLSLIQDENGLAVACDGDRIVSYAMAASWDYWSPWPLFQHMIADLHTITYLGRVLDTKNSYQYGPVCIDKEYRGRGVLEHIFEFSRRQMMHRFPVMVTFINQINPRSYEAHTRKLGMELIKTFEFNNNQYYELGYDMSRQVPGTNL
ncbi:MAG: GNAT family acetyltransferase [Synergistaceae bacterium]|nr:GNAT family acetyltransferase [Synergistaceae bacterium]